MARKNLEDEVFGLTFRRLGFFDHRPLKMLLWDLRCGFYETINNTLRTKYSQEPWVYPSQ